jgi:hypothetical protein
MVAPTMATDRGTPVIAADYPFLDVLRPMVVFYVWILGQIEKAKALLDGSAITRARARRDRAEGARLIGDA